MKIILIILSFILVSCSPEKKGVYMCGDRECLDKKEVEEYFSKNFSIEFMFDKEKKDDSLNLIELNTNNQKIKKKSNTSFKEKRKISNLKKREKKDELKKRRKLAKLNEIKKRKEIKKEKNNEKLKLKEIKKNLKKEKKSKKIKQKEKTKEFCLLLEECDIDEISEYFIKIGEQKEYPDITKK